MIKRNSQYSLIVLVFLQLVILVSSCKAPALSLRNENVLLPAKYADTSDTINSSTIDWRSYFADDNLTALIDTAFKNNQDLNIISLEIEILNNEVMAKSGEYKPFVNINAGAEEEKQGEFTRNGAVDEQLKIKDGKKFPSPLGNFIVQTNFNWELDIWKKLRNAKKSAVLRYLASIEGRNFAKTRLVAEIASSYYELMALDNLASIIDQNIVIQSNALEVVRKQKEAAGVTQLAVNRFEAQLLNTQNRQYEIKQRIVETENKINFLTGRYPVPVNRNSQIFTQLSVDAILAGVPSQLLKNRPDIRQSELLLSAAKLDVDVARARFYPSVGIRAGLGLNAFNPLYLINPQSLAFNLAGDLVGPLVNKNAIKVAYASAGASQVQAVFTYEQTILTAYLDVLNQLSKMEKFTKSFETKSKEVEILDQSVIIANSLFNSARADYAEVLLTQKEALESRIDLVETKMKQLDGKINIYKALGGGWQ